MRRILFIALATVLLMGCGSAPLRELGLGGSSDSPEMAEFRTEIKTILLTQPGSGFLCQAIRGSSDKEVLALMVGVVGQDKATAAGLDKSSPAQLRGAAIMKEECIRLFGDD